MLLQAAIVKGASPYLSYEERNPKAVEEPSPAPELSTDSFDMQSMGLGTVNVAQETSDATQDASTSSTQPATDLDSLFSGLGSPVAATQQGRYVEHFPLSFRLCCQTSLGAART